LGSVPDRRGQHRREHARDDDHGDDDRQPAATSLADSSPSPKCAASDNPLVTTEIASAVDSVPLGVDTPEDLAAARKILGAGD